MKRSTGFLCFFNVVETRILGFIVIVHIAVEKNGNSWMEYCESIEI